MIMLLQPPMTATASDRQNMDDKARFLLFYCSIPAPPPPLLCNNTPNPAFESLDLFGSLESGRKSLFSTKILLKSPRRSGDLVRLSLQSSPLHVFYYNTHTSCDRQSLPFRTKPAQYSHTACGQVPFDWSNQSHHSVFRLISEAYCSFRVTEGHGFGCT